MQRIPDGSAKQDKELPAVDKSGKASGADKPEGQGKAAPSQDKGGAGVGAGAGSSTDGQKSDAKGADGKGADGKGTDGGKGQADGPTDDKAGEVRGTCCCSLWLPCDHREEHDCTRETLSRCSSMCDYVPQSVADCMACGAAGCRGRRARTRARNPFRLRSSWQRWAPPS